MRVFSMFTSTANRQSPGTLPFIGNGLVFLRPRQELFDWFTRCIRQYGHETLGIILPILPPGVIIADPVNLDFVFKHEELFQKGQFFRHRLQDLFGYGIVNVDGDLWRKQRAAGTHFFNGATMKSLTESELPRALEQTVRQLDQYANSDTALDLEVVFHELTTQLIGRLAYGAEMHANDEFTTAFDHASAEIAKRFQNPLWRWTELITGGKLTESVRVIRRYGQDLVAQTIKKRKVKDGPANLEGNNTASNLIETLLDSLGDQELVADSALNYLSAGKDTIAQALTWTFYLLIMHQGVAEKIYYLHIGTGSQSTQDGRCQSSMIQQDLSPETTHFILAVFYESLRLYPPIPFDMKEAQNDTILPDGTCIPKGSVVLWCTWAMNRSAKTWGEDADTFRPERWLEGGRFKQRTTGEFPVFQGGARLCLGKKMAERIAVQVIATLTRLFIFERDFEGEKTSPTHLTLPMEGGLQVCIKDRCF
ncbi:hypothetical protein CDV31_010614 [Fusarium ambrosium]|uniref:Cytochrome P450 n=1 Tax=Fusarium ambrosium TaxID=131363 RepID=A0A428TM42_9HYPO|nr:hypothetical protein CDV31_010614 [Fusarium ambrosium]